MEITTEDITPEMAQKYLGHNRDNRKIRKSRVDQYASQMTKGQWLVTGDPVRFDPNGRLLDGQHRLLAIIQSETTQTMVVCRDVPTEAFSVLDSGLQRSFADALGVGVPNGTKKAAVCRLMYVYELDADPRQSYYLGLVSKTDVKQYYELNKDEIDAAVSSGQRISARMIGVNQTAWASLHIVAHRADPETAHRFVEGVITGVELGAGDARLALRNWMINDNGRQFPNAGWHFALFIKAWNKYIRGETSQIMALKPNEPFPVLVTERKVMS